MQSGFSWPAKALWVVVQPKQARNEKVGEFMHTYGRRAMARQ